MKFYLHYYKLYFLQVMQAFFNPKVTNHNHAQMFCLINTLIFSSHQVSLLLQCLIPIVDYFPTRLEKPKRKELARAMG